MDNKKVKKRRILQALLGKPFALGDSSKGFDCFFMSYYYLYLLGNKLPREWKGVSLRGYKKIRDENVNKARELMFDFMKEHTDGTDNNIQFGDILRLKPKFNPSKPDFLAIYNGKGNIIAASVRKGICIMNLYDYKILDIYRSKK